MARFPRGLGWPTSLPIDRIASSIFSMLNRMPCWRMPTARISSSRESGRAVRHVPSSDPSRYALEAE